jgi:hypothetical protein
MSRTGRVSAVFASLAVLAAWAPTAALAPAALAEVPASHGTQVSESVRHDVSPPLRDLHVSAPSAATDTEQPIMRISPGRGGGPDTAVQTTTTTNINVSPNGFEGVGQGEYGFNVQWAPPDTNGDVGLTQYVQWVNTYFAVFDKSTHELQLLAPGNTPWAGFGGDCQDRNDGDPIVQYDQLADRWVLTQFTRAAPYMQCVAVSTSGDATGSYYRYAFSYGDSFPDYPKLGVWPDAYYASYNMFGSTFLGAQACAFDRAAMLVGADATQQCVLLTNYGGSLLPSDLDGSTLPPAGSPAYYLNFTTNTLQMWRFHVDWANPANSGLSGPTALPVAPFSTACNGGGACIPQPDTTQPLHSVGDRLMYRLAYRHFADGHEALVVNQSVSVSGVTSVRWYELRNANGHTMANGTPVVYQQATLSAADGMHRWMGSLAMDHDGNIALGYSASSATSYPSIRLTGRLASDGTGSQLQNLSRWGDYSAMTVDPADDCTFWYTNEYLKTNGTWNWNTWIASFKFDSCGSGGGPTTGAVSGVVTDASTGNPLAGATVAVNGAAAATTLSDGSYAVTGLVPATYSVSATASGYDASPPQSVDVSAGATSTADFQLAPTVVTTTVPGAPGTPTASAARGKGISVSWSPPADDGGSPVSGYFVYRYPGCGSTSDATFSSSNTQMKDTTTKKNSWYCYTVAAVNAVGTGPQSARSNTVQARK